MLQSLLHLIVMRKGNEVCYQQRRYGGQQHVSEELLVPQQITKEFVCGVVAGVAHGNFFPFLMEMLIQTILCRAGESMPKTFLRNLKKVLDR